MRLSTMLDYSRGVKQSADHVADLERAGLDIVWVAEAYGLDGPSQMGYIAAKTETHRDRLGHPAHLLAHARRCWRRPQQGSTP